MPECKHLIDPAESCGTCYPPPGTASPPELRGPWFTASYPGECDDCGDGIVPGDDIRADGLGGYLCDACGQDSLLA